MGPYIDVIEKDEKTKNSRRNVFKKKKKQKRKIFNKKGEKEKALKNYEKYHINKQRDA